MTKQCQWEGLRCPISWLNSKRVLGRRLEQDGKGCNGVGEGKKGWIWSETGWNLGSSTHWILFPPQTLKPNMELFRVVPVVLLVQIEVAPLYELYRQYEM